MNRIPTITLTPSGAVPEKPGLDMTALPLIGQGLRQGWLMTALRVAVLFLFLVALGTGFWQEDARVGLAVLLMWGVFWPLFTSITTPTLGNVFCAVCPLAFVGKQLSRIGLKRSMPGWLKGVWAGLVLIVLCYWLVSFAMPGVLSSSTRNTAWFFLLFTLAAFVSFYLFKGMAWCKHLCPLGRVLAAHGRAGALSITTHAPACETCTSYDCVRACSYQLSPPSFALNNNTQSCTLCGDCLTACPEASLVATVPGRRLMGPIEKQYQNEFWVYLIILAVAGVGIQMLHGVQHTPLAPSLPWNVLGGELQSLSGWSKEVFDISKALALVLALAVTVPVALLGYHLAARQQGLPWKTLANRMAPALAPLAILGLIPHAVLLFATRNAHNLANESGRLFGLDWAVAPLAVRGDAWLSWIEVLPYIAMLWTAALLWQRAGLITQAPMARLRLSLYAGAAALVYLVLFGIKLAANLLMTAPASMHLH